MVFGVGAIFGADVRRSRGTGLLLAAYVQVIISGPGRALTPMVNVAEGRSNGAMRLGLVRDVCGLADAAKSES